MDQIAAEAGVSKLTVYSHFGDKEALFAAAVQGALRAAAARRAVRRRAGRAAARAPAADRPRVLRDDQRARGDRRPPHPVHAADGRLAAAADVLGSRPAARAGRVRRRSCARRVAAGELEIADIPRAAVAVLRACSRASCTRSWCSAAARCRRAATSSRTWTRRSTCSCAPMRRAGDAGATRMAAVTSGLLTSGTQCRCASTAILSPPFAPSPAHAR